MDRTLSFSVNQLYGVHNREEWMQAVHQSLTQVYKEDDIEGVQVYPGEWPRRVRILVNSLEVKNALYVAGLDIFGQHVDLQDDQLGQPIVVMITDIPIDMCFDRVAEILQTFGKVIDVKDELLKVNGRQTKWKTGTKFVTMGGLLKKIPEKIAVYDDLGRESTIFLKCNKENYRVLNAQRNFCRNCGSPNHKQENCVNDKKLCYACGSDSHLQFQCPKKMKRGTRENETVHCFRGESSVLSNFNKDYPIVVNGKTFVCNEQFIVHEKAKMFGDMASASQVMQMTNPLKMKHLGGNIENYEHQRWKQNSVKIIASCNQIKYESHPAAMKVLMATGHKTIGEATASREWGIGININNDECLDTSKWTGANKMGKILMKIRDNQYQKLDARQQVLGSNASQRPANRNASILELPLDADLMKQGQSVQLNSDEYPPLPCHVIPQPSTVCTEEKIPGDNDGVLQDCQKNGQGMTINDSLLADFSFLASDGATSDIATSTPQKRDGKSSATGHMVSSMKQTEPMEIDGSSTVAELNFQGVTTAAIDAAASDFGALAITDWSFSPPSIENHVQAENSSNFSLQINTPEAGVVLSSDVCVVIGDSNAVETVLSEDMPFRTETIGKRNLMISDVAKTLDEHSLDCQNVKVVLVHVGSNDFSTTERTDLKQLCISYVNMLEVVMNVYSKAVLIVSSVLPRAKQNVYQQEFENVNREIAEFNEMLRMFCDSSSIEYLDNFESFTDDFEIRDHLYRIHTISGIHLSKRGLEVLEDTFQSVLSDQYFKQKLRQDYDVDIQRNDGQINS